MAEPADLRISDDDREQARTVIREHFAAGRLSEDEFADRVEGVYRARTQRELLDLQADLPRLPESPQQQRAELAARRRDLQRRVLQESGGGIAAFVICTVIWAATGAEGSFWPMWVGLVVLVSLVRNGWRLYGPAPELDRVEAELDRRRRAER